MYVGPEFPENCPSPLELKMHIQGCFWNLVDITFDPPYSFDLDQSSALLFSTMSGISVVVRAFPGIKPKDDTFEITLYKGAYELIRGPFVVSTLVDAKYQVAEALVSAGAQDCFIGTRIRKDARTEVVFRVPGTYRGFVGAHTAAREYVQKNMSAWVGICEKSDLTGGLWALTYLAAWAGTQEQGPERALPKKTL